MRYFIRCARALGLVALFAFPLTAQAASFSPQQKGEIEQIIHDYLVENPEVLIKAMNSLQEKQAKAEADQAEKALSTHVKEIFQDPNSFVAGNPKGDVTVVEFFDYQCGYCKKSLPELLKLIKSDKNVRVVLKEYPILSADSVIASKAALASISQGKYFEFHQALMEHHGALSEAVVLNIAEDTGLNIKKLKTDMASAKIENIITANEKLATALAIRGTPAFIIGDTVVGGAISASEMAVLVQEARAKKKK